MRLLSNGGRWFLVRTLLFLAALVAAPASLPQSQNAVVFGTVFDARGDPMPGATVTLENAVLGFNRWVMTGSDGTFNFAEVPPGNDYRITASKDGQTLDIRAGIGINSGDERLILPPLREQDEALQLVAKATQALGGEARLRALRSSRYRTLWRAKFQGSEQLWQRDFFFLVPDHVHFEARSAAGTFLYVISPSAAFAVGADAKPQDLPAWVQPYWLAIMKRSPENVLRNASLPGYSFRLAGEGMMAGVTARILEVNAAGEQVRWFVDPETGRILRSVSRTTGASGAIEQVVDFSDFRTADGYTIPFRWSVVENGVEIGREEVLEVQVNPPVDLRLFQKPPLSLASIPFTPAVIGELAPIASAPPAPEPAVPKPAALTISSRPGSAQVYLDDEPKGTTSAEGRLVLKDLAAGSRRLRLSLAGYDEWSQVIELAAGVTRTVEATLAPAGPPPFTLQDVVKMLEGDIHPKRVATLVQETGVDFALTDAAEKQLRAAGADSDLLLAVAKARK